MSRVVCLGQALLGNESDNLMPRSTDTLAAYTRMMNENPEEYDEIKVIETLQAHPLTRVKTKLQGLSSRRQATYPACFMRDMEWIIATAHKLPYTTTEYDDVELELSMPVLYLVHAIRDLRVIASLARKNAIQQLSLCDTFKITPTLIYVDICSSEHYSITMTELLSIPENSIEDILATLLQHRHILKHVYSFGCSRFNVSLSDLHAEVRGDESWFSHAECANQRVSLVRRCLHSTTSSTSEFQ